MRSKNFIIFGILGAILAFHAKAFAASSIELSGQSGIIGVGDTVSVDVIVSSNAPVNAYSAEIAFPPNMLSLTGTVTKDSLITIWEGAASVRSDSVSFAGGSVNPFVGEGGKLITVNFRALAPGKASLTVRNAAVYLANGKGTKIIPEARGFAFTIGERSTALPAGTPSSSFPVHIVTMKIIRDALAQGAPLLTFQAEDGGAGIRTIQVRSRAGFLWSSWQPARNPSPLPPGTWEASLRITDGGGAVVEGTAYDTSAFVAFIVRYTVTAAVVVLVLVVAFRRKREVR